MTIVYGVFGLIWMVFSVMNYKELIRIQFWIGGVIFLGMLEKAVFYSEYSAVNHSGLSLTGAHKFAQAVSALKVEPNNHNHILIMFSVHWQECW